EDHHQDRRQHRRCGTHAGHGRLRQRGERRPRRGGGQLGRPRDHRHQVRPAGPRPAGRQRLPGLRRHRRPLRGQGARLHRRDVQGVAVGPARDAAAERPGRDDLRDLLDHRRAQAEGLLRRPLLRRRPGPAGEERQHRHHRPGLPRRQEALLGDRLHVGAEDQGQLRLRRAAAGVRHLLQVRAGPEQRDDRRGHHRQRHPRRLRGPVAVPGQAQGRRRPLLGGALRRRHQAGRHRPVRVGEHRDPEDGRRRVVAEGSRRHRRGLGLQARHRHQPAEAGRLLL
ncbi:MAG: Glutamate ABC transporter, substrate-binding protein GluB, partial [uncultured Friedmanniella sp.]